MNLRTTGIAFAFFLLFEHSICAQTTEPVVIPFDEVPLVYAIEGTVVNEDGDPVNNATVRAMAGPDGAPIVRTAQSDRFGRFSFRDLPEAREWMLLAFHPSYALPSYKGGGLSIDLPRTADAPPAEIVMVKAHTYRGLVLDVDGTPAVGARVLPGADHHVLDAESTGEYEIVTDEDGRFQFTQLAMAKPSFWIWHEDRPVHLAGPEDLPPDGVFRLTNGLTIIGCVTNEQGEHQEGVSLMSPGGRYGQSYGPWFTSSAEDGSFRFDGIPEFILQLRSGRSALFSPSISVAIDDNRFKKDHYGLYLTAEKTLPFVEIVVRSAGEPGEGRGVDVGKVQGGAATVTVRLSTPPPPDTDESRSWIEIHGVFGQEPGFDKRESLRGAEAVTFREVPPGEYKISANTPEIAFEPQTIHLQPLDQIDLLLKPGPSILTGRVTGLAPDEARPTIHWWIESEGPGRVAVSGSARVTAYGTYTVTGIIPGYCGIQVNVGAVWFPHETITVRPGENRHDLALPSTRIEGRVVDFDPASRINDDRGDVEIRGEITLPRGITANDDGTFRVDHLPPGSYTVLYRAARRKLKTSQEVVLGDGDRVYVELALPAEVGMIAGTVLGVAEMGIEPNARRGYRASVFAMNVAKSNDATYGAADWHTGHYEIKNLEPGRYVVRVNGEAMMGFAREVEVKPNSQTLLDIELMELRHVVIRLLSSRPYRPARVRYEIENVEDELIRAQRSFGNDFGVSEEKVDVDMEHDLPPGSYVLTATFGSDDPIVLPFDLPPGDEPLQLEVRRD